jgi:hypothetical protein
MKRRGNVISPIDTINTLQEMLVGTDFTVEDGELVYVRLTQQWFVYRVNSGLVVDGINVIAPAYGNGVWELLNIGPGGANAGLGPFNTIATGAVGSGRLIDVTAGQIALLKRGNLAWVESVRDFFLWDPTSALAQDTFNAGGTPMTIVNPTANGVNPGRFLREFTAQPQWRAQRQWVVRPTTGNDENSGADDVTPLASNAELQRRLGMTGGVRPEFLPGDYHFFFPEAAGTVAGQNARPYFAGRRSVTPSGSAFAFNTQFYLHGNTPATVGQGVAFAGPFTISAVTPVNHATNQTLEVASAGIVGSWTAANLITLPGTSDVTAKRCRMTTGANIGGTFWAKEDLGNKLGGNPTAMCDEPNGAQTFSGSFAPVTATFTPAVGEQFVVETIVQLSSLVLDTDSTVSVITDSLQPSIQEAHGATIFIMAANIPMLTQQNYNGFISRTTVAGSRFSGPTSTGNTWIPCDMIDIFNCNFDGSCHLRNREQGNITRAFVHGTSSGLGLSTTRHSRPNTSSTRTDGWLVNSVGMFNVPNTLPFTIRDSAQLSATCDIWGNGNAFAPILLLANARLYWTAADVRGGAPPASFFFINVAASSPANVWVTCDDVTNGANIPAWDTATNTFTANRLLSPANLQATVAAGGFNGRFFDPVSGCQMVATQQG